jgi:hypothetical protein
MPLKKEPNTAHWTLFSQTINIVIIANRLHRNKPVNHLVEILVTGRLLRQKFGG